MQTFSHEHNGCHVHTAFAALAPSGKQTVTQQCDVDVCVASVSRTSSQSCSDFFKLTEQSCDSDLFSAYKAEALQRQVGYTEYLTLPLDVVGYDRTLARSQGCLTMQSLSMVIWDCLATCCMHSRA
jgi:hypothetical protein